MVKIFKHLLVLVALTSVILAGGGTRTGTAGASELLIPVGAAGLALNGANITSVSGIEAMFYNPAGLGATQSSAEALFSHMTYLADINVNYAAVAVHFEGLGSLGFNIKSLDFGEIPVTTVNAPQGTGSTFSPTYVTLGLTYSNALTDRIRAGINVKVVTEQIMRTSSTVVAFDGGVQYNDLAGISGLQIGIVMKNLGPQMTYDGEDLLRRAEAEGTWRGQQFYSVEAESFELPSQLELGIAYFKPIFQDVNLLVTHTYANNNFSPDEFRFGGELSYKDMLFVRGGYALMPQTTNEWENLYGPTFGAGVKLSGSINVQFDYAFRYARYFDPNHMFAVKFGF